MSFSILTTSKKEFSLSDCDYVGEKISHISQAEARQKLNALSKLLEQHKDCHLVLKFKDSATSVENPVSSSSAQTEMILEFLDTSANDENGTQLAKEAIKYLFKSADYSTHKLRKDANEQLTANFVLTCIQDAVSNQVSRDQSLKNCAVDFSNTERLQYGIHIYNNGTGTLFRHNAHNLVLKTFSHSVDKVLCLDKKERLVRTQLSEYMMADYRDISSSYVKGIPEIVTPTHFIVQETINRQTHTWKVNGGKEFRRWMKQKLQSGSQLKITGLIMPYISGKTLDQMIRDGHRSSQKIEEICYKIICVLEKLATQGILHNDLSINNVIIDDNNDIKIIDLERMEKFHKGESYCFKFKDSGEIVDKRQNDTCIIDLCAGYIDSFGHSVSYQEFIQLKNQIFDKKHKLHLSQAEYLEYIRGVKEIFRPKDFQGEQSVITSGAIHEPTTDSNEPTIESNETYYEYWTNHGFARIVLLVLLTPMTLGMIWIMIGLNSCWNRYQHAEVERSTDDTERLIYDKEE